jgi:hypothetical protein
MPRFVVLDHDHPLPHFDLMLEVGPVLWTWRLERPPEAGPEQSAERIPDHRPHYLDYEGPVSGNRGRVLRRDEGTFVWLVQEEDRLELRLEGRGGNGTLILRKRVPPLWSMRFVPDVNSRPISAEVPAG